MANNEEESKLINQGTYGCIYYPSLPFKQKHHQHNDDDYKSDIKKRRLHVSKIQKHNFHSEFEDYVGKKIQDIPSFDTFFVPVLNTYKIDLATINQSYVTKCDAISQYINPDTYDGTLDYKILNKKFIMQKIKYINGIYLHRYLMRVVNTRRDRDSDSDRDSDRYSDSDSDSDSDGDSDNDNEYINVSKSLRKDEHQIKKYRSEFKHDETTSSYELMSIVFDIYERIMDSVQVLIKFKIVHYDLKQNNILVENIQQLPYIIDFGLSIDVERLLQHKWSDKDEEDYKSRSTSKDDHHHNHHHHSRTKQTIDSNVLRKSDSSKIFKDNYLWKQHFYIHAPDYFLWPIEVHLITYLINEHNILTEESLRKICYEYIAKNRAIEYTSSEFKKKLFDLSVETFSRFIHQPREKVLNELLTYWDKWDIYAINIMFLKIMYELIFHREVVSEGDRSDSDPVSKSASASASASLNEERQQKLDPHYSSDTKIEFKSRYKIKLKQKYSSHKIMNTIQVMLRNIHPNPDKRMTPQETKTFFVSIFYEC
jgi:hypothetical protein